MKTYKKVTLLTLTVALGVTTWLATSWQGKRVDHMMGLMDVDRNGMLQIEEVSPLMRLRFIELDSDGDGSLGSSEISAYIRSSLFNVILRK